MVWENKGALQKRWCAWMAQDRLWGFDCPELLGQSIFQILREQSTVEGQMQTRQMNMLSRTCTRTSWSNYVFSVLTPFRRETLELPITLRLLWFYCLLSMCPKDRGGYARTWRSVGQPNLFQISERGEAAAQVLQSAEGPLSSEQKEFPRFSTDAWVPFVQTDCHSSLACGFRVGYSRIFFRSFAAGFTSRLAQSISSVCPKELTRWSAGSFCHWLRCDLQVMTCGNAKRQRRAWSHRWG